MIALYFFIYSWLIIFNIRMICALFGLIYCYRMTVIELKFYNYIKESSKELKPIYNYFPLNKLIFSPNHFDLWSSKSFFKYAINERLNRNEDIIFIKHREKFNNFSENKDECTY